MKWVKLGCSLLTTLMSGSEGVRYLGSEDQLVSQIVRGFAQLDPVRFFFDSSIVPSFTYYEISSMVSQIQILYSQKGVFRKR